MADVIRFEPLDRHIHTAWPWMLRRQRAHMGNVLKSLRPSVAERVKVLNYWTARYTASQLADLADMALKIPEFAPDQRGFQ